MPFRKYRAQHAARVNFYDFPWTPNRHRSGSHWDCLLKQLRFLAPSLMSTAYKVFFLAERSKHKSVYRRPDNMFYDVFDWNNKVFQGFYEGILLNKFLKWSLSLKTVTRVENIIHKTLLCPLTKSSYKKCVSRHFWKLQDTWQSEREALSSKANTSNVEREML